MTSVGRVTGRLLKKPEASSPVAAVGFIASILALYQAFGPAAAFIGTVAVIAFYASRDYRRARRVRAAEEALVAALPHQHSYFLEFLRQTYRLPSDEEIRRRNSGITVHLYQNNFVVRGSDCENYQVIEATNTSHVPVAGLAFALVGGSSANAASLNSQYTFNGERRGAPEFIRDAERFKLVFNRFPVPVLQDGRFTITYSDEWKGSMRAGADGFFFPEALFFPAGLHRLESRIDFSFLPTSIAVLQVDLNTGTVGPCATQPRIVAPQPGMKCAYEWRTDSPAAGNVYVIYYHG